MYLRGREPIKSVNRLWIFIFIYVLLIYTTLPIARSFLNTLYGTLGAFNLNLFVNTLLVGVFSFIALQLYRKRGLCSFVHLFLLGVLLVTIILNLDRPEERIHFVEYGLLGFLFVKAFSSTYVRTFTFSALLVTLIGSVDELIQWFLPNRVGDLRDVLMNAVGGLLGVWFGKLYYS